MKIENRQKFIFFFVIFFGIFSLSGCDIDKILGRDKEVPAAPAPEPEPEPDPEPTCGAISGKVRIANPANPDGWYWSSNNQYLRVHIVAGNTYKDVWESEWTFVNGKDYGAEYTYKLGSESLYSNKLSPGTYVVYFVDNSCGFIEDQEITNVRVYAGEITTVGTVTLQVNNPF